MTRIGRIRCLDNVASTRLLKVGWGGCYHNVAPTALEGGIERGSR